MNGGRSVLLYRRIARMIPDMRLKLVQARMEDTPEYYIQKTFFLAFFVMAALEFILFGFTKDVRALLLAPVIYLLAFIYLLHNVDLRIKRLRDEVSKEIVFAGRFLIVALESGVPMYQAFKNIAQNYGTIGTYFQEIIERVELGTPMEEAINETINNTPSPELRRMLWQLLNSLKTGSAVTIALTNVFDQIVREQNIQVKEYGRKLNPLAMFYMMSAIILPSLGTIMLMVLTTFIGLKLDLLILMVLCAAILFVQLMFLAMIKSSRPPVDM